MTTPPPDKAVQRLTKVLADAGTKAVVKTDDLRSALAQLAAANQRIAELERQNSRLSNVLGEFDKGAHGYRAQLAAQSRALEEAIKAVKALLTVMDNGPKPVKLDEALSWRQCDELARKMAEDVLRRAAQASGEE